MFQSDLFGDKIVNKKMLVTAWLGSMCSPCIGVLDTKSANLGQLEILGNEEKAMAIFHP
jgi:hypothetical protein